MSNVTEVKVPDIGDFKDVPVIEVLVKVGDQVNIEDALVTLESDKATIDVPSPVNGVIKEIKVKAGDKVSQNSLLFLIETATTTSIKTETKTEIKPKAETSSAAPTKPPSANSEPVVSSNKSDIDCEILVIGAGPGGYSAAFRAADLGKKVVLVERYSTLGGVCLNVGCIPSKALLHVTSVMTETESLAEHGISFGKPKVDIDKLRGWKEKVIGKLTGGLTAMAKARKVTVVTGVANFINDHQIEVSRKDNKQTISFQHAIIAAGSEAVKLPFLPKDDRIIDSTGALELKSVPKNMLIIGGGIIGLEMATVYATLGAKVDIVEMQSGLMLGADRDLVKAWEKFNKNKFNKIMLETKTESAEARKDGIYIKFSGKQAPAEAQRYDLVLVATGRSPNGKKMGAEKAGILVNDKGFIVVDNQMRTNISHIFAIGDINGQPMLAHKAVHEGHVAAEVAAGEKSFFDARQIPSVAYIDPEIAWAGVTEEQCQQKFIAYQKSVFPWAASGRAIANGRTEGFTKLIFDEKTKRIIGGSIVGTNAGELIGEICLAIEMGCDAVDIGKTIHPHPTLSESVGMAAEVFEGVCTDLLPDPKAKH